MRLVLLCLVHVVGANVCVRPIASHYLNADTPTNSSITLFADYPPRQTKLYLNSGHSKCIAPTSGTHTFFCNGIIMKLRCQQGLNWELGIGLESQLYNHYSTIEISHNVLRLSDEHVSDLSLESSGVTEMFRVNQIECQVYSRTCSSNKTTYPVVLDTSVSHTVLPFEFYAFVLEEFEKGNAPELACKFSDNTEIVCGYNCLWMSNIIDGTRLNVVQGNEIRFSQRILDNYKFTVNNKVATTQLAITKQGTFYNNGKMLIEIFLLIKIIFLGWRATVKHEDEREMWYLTIPFIWLCVLVSAPIGLQDYIHVIRVLVTMTLGIIAMLYLYFENLGDIRHTVPKLILMTALPELDNNESKIIAFSLIIVLTAIELQWFIAQQMTRLPGLQDTFMILNLMNSLVFIAFCYDEYLKLYLDMACSLYSFHYVEVYHALYFVCIFYGTSMSHKK